MKFEYQSMSKRSYLHRNKIPPAGIQIRPIKLIPPGTNKSLTFIKIWTTNGGTIMGTTTKASSWYLNKQQFPEWIELV